jgi:hypothetical protein
VTYKKKKKKKSWLFIKKKNRTEALSQVAVRFFQCCDEKDRTPIIGCGSKFSAVLSSDVSCPRCYNLYVKLIMSPGGISAKI